MKMIAQLEKAPRTTRQNATGTASAIARNSVESDHGCISRIYFDNAGDNVTLTLYTVTLMSQKPCNTIASVIAAEQTAEMKINVFFNKISL